MKKLRIFIDMDGVISDFENEEKTKNKSKEIQ